MPKVATKDKKETTRREKKDPNAPKRALSAYMFFVQDYRERIKSENPDASFGEVGKLLGAKWKEMGAAEKKPYEQQAEKDKERAANDKSNYVKPTSAPAKKSKAKPAPKEASEDDDDDDDE